jgi:Mg-chelatase subunit ChlD
VSPSGLDDGGLVKEGAAAEQAVQQAARRSISRRELGRHEKFEEISPEVGVLDEDALSQQLDDDPDAALALLADLTGATDPQLKALARAFAGRIVVDLARRGPVRRRGIGRMTRQPYRPDAGDIDIDASLEQIALARKIAPDPDELRVRGWSKPGTAICLVVDRSGSMSGGPLAAAAVGAAAVAWRAPADHSVVAFSSEAIVLKSQGEPRPPERVVNDLFTLRGFGTTDVALALRVAARQLSSSRAARRIAVLLSDARATVPGDVAGAARSIDELWVVAPEGDSDEAQELARAVGARFTTVAGPSDIPAAFSKLLDA